MGRSKQAVPRQRKEHIGDECAGNDAASSTAAPSSSSSSKSKRLFAKHAQLWRKDEEKESDDDDDTNDSNRHDDDDDLFLGRIPCFLRQQQQQTRSISKDDETAGEEDMFALLLATRKSQKGNKNNNDPLSLLFAAELLSTPPLRADDEGSRPRNDDNLTNKKRTSTRGSSITRLSRIQKGGGNVNHGDEQDDEDAFLFESNHNKQQYHEPKCQQQPQLQNQRRQKRQVIMDDDEDEDDEDKKATDKKAVTSSNDNGDGDVSQKSQPPPPPQRRRLRDDDDDDMNKDDCKSKSSRSITSQEQQQSLEKVQATRASTAAGDTTDSTTSETIHLMFVCSTKSASEGVGSSSKSHSSHDNNEINQADERMIQCFYTPPSSDMVETKKEEEDLEQQQQDCFELLRVPVPSHVRIIVNNENNMFNEKNEKSLAETSSAATTVSSCSSTPGIDQQVQSLPPSSPVIFRSLPVTTAHSLWQLGRVTPYLETLLRQKTHVFSNNKKRMENVDDDQNGDDDSLAFSFSSIIQCLGHGTVRVDLVANDSSTADATTNACWSVRLAIVKTVALYQCHATQLPLLPRNSAAGTIATKKYQAARELHVALATIFADCALLRDTARLFAAASATIQAASMPKKKKATARRRKGNSKSSSSDNRNDDTQPSPSIDGKVDDNADSDSDKAVNKNTIISAKQVYHLTDNCQLKRVLQQKPKASSLSSCWTEKIKGLLLPTLRPYQEAAVEWMLQRENEASQQKSEEWKLAWIVFLKSRQHAAHVLPLYEYRHQPRQHHHEHDEKDQEDSVLLFCPFTGWLADSIQQAQSMMMAAVTTTKTDAATTTQGQAEQPVIRGGILAEAMGLGKTVEVLACILANPRPPVLATTGGESSVTNQTTTTTATAKRRLNFGDNDQHEEKTPSTASTEDTTSAETGAAGNDGGMVGDLNDFCDADYDDESSLSSAKETTNDINGSSNECDANIPGRLETVEQNGTAAPTTGVPVIPVTPDDKNIARDGDGTAPAVNEADEDEDVRWVEDDEPLGSCICGSLIGLHDLKNASIVFCPDCDEPMHMECAAFASEEEMESASSPLVYRRLFTNQQWISRLLSSPTNDRCMNWAGKGHCHYCPCCVADTGRLIPSRATLIVTPPAILGQWKREIQRHTQQQGPDGKPCLRVVVYDGVAKTAKYFGPRKQDVASRMELVHPHKLADADVVLLTYDTLRADLGHSDGNPFLTADGSSNLRKRKRYRVVPSPLTSIHWWRVCLDEAQRVESTTVLSAQMALKLQCEYRWGITGTPVGRGKIEDLFGLLLFLRMKPFTWKLLFNKCFNSEFFGVGDRIQCLLQDVFWRSTKDFELVREQMGVPEQVEVKVHLRFSSIEKHFYDRQLEQTLLTAGDVAERERSGKKHKRKELDLLAEQLHRLRAACCHPQVGSSGLNKKQGPGARKKQRPGARKAATGAAIATAGKKTASTEKAGTSAVGSRVMTMDEILTRFIEDAKLKCEESQRLAVMHTNAMAAISRLKVEARDRGIEIDQTDAQLLTQSCKLYLESLDVAEENARPTHVLGNAVLTGATGFLSSRKSMKDGAAQMDWKLSGTATSSSSPSPEVWARVDFEGPSRKLVQVRVRPIREIPVLLLSETSDDFFWRLLHPKTVVFQVASAAVGGEFVNVGEMTCPPPLPLPSHAQDDNEDSDDSDSWVVGGGFRTNKSKSWRLVVKSYYDDDAMESQRQAHHQEEPSGLYVGLDVQLLEAEIASDALQRLHCLHNASLSFSSLLQVRENGNDQDESLSAFPNFATSTDLTQRLVTMKKEAEKIESLYMDVARSLHQECHRRFEEWSTSRCKLEAELLELSRASPLLLPGNRSRLQDCWDDGWWDDFLVTCHVHGTEFHQRTLCERVLDELDRLQGGPERGLIRFPTFRDLSGLRVALSTRIQGIRSGIGKEAAWIGTHDDEQPEHQTLYQFREDRFRCSRGMFAKCMQEIGSFSPTPSDKEMFENSHCRVCKADWNQQGPTCRHCHIGNKLNELEPDRVTLCLLNSIYGVLRGPVGRTVCDNDNGACIDERAKKFFNILESQKKEKVFAWRHWRTHLDLLNDLDELGQCKASMRLSLEDEDLTTLTDDQLNAIVVPIDLNTRYHDHAAKQAMALGDLRRAKDTLRYLRNQSAEQQQARSRQEEEQCLVCYEPFDTDRAVLQCGHSFHFTPCLKKLQARTTIGGSICCPLRCRVRTHPSKVMIASEKRHDDGSRSKRNIQGSWGTKVTRLVSDLLDVQDVGDKAVLFSQWDDMLDIVQEALIANGIRHVRATLSKETGDFVNRFRAVDCTALLLNVKHGAEGLTIVEATHVFMVEPLMNHGLDLQAISRVCRIGQTKKTYVHRYIMQGTVEVKIDAVRMEHQGDNLEDAILEGKNTTIRAGGIDGGFRSETELLDLLHIPGDDDENKASAPATAVAREA